MTLEKGMAIWSTGYAMERFVITKTTATQAIIEKTNGIGNKYELRFNREIPENGSFRERGSSIYCGTRYQIETPELIAKYNRKILMQSFKNIIPEKLTDEQLENIIKISRIN